MKKIAFAVVLLSAGTLGFAIGEEGGGGAGRGGSSTVTLYAIDTDSIMEDGRDYWHDDRLRAYQGTLGNWLDGFIKFDFSSLPGDAIIDEMTLTTFHEGLLNSPFQNPEVRVYRSAGDSWSNQADDDFPGLNEILSPIYTSFPTGAADPFDWTLDPTAVNWSEDLADDILSLVLRDEVTTYSYAYWYGAYGSHVPTLRITYSTGAVPEPATLLLLGGLLPLLKRKRR